MFDLKENNTIATINFDKLSELIKIVGKEKVCHLPSQWVLFLLTHNAKIVLDLSCRRSKTGNQGYMVVTNRWQTFTDVEVNEKSLLHLSQFCDEFLVHGVDVEGMKMGIEEDLVKIVCYIYYNK